VFNFVLFVLATFWVWETVRYAFESFLPVWFGATRFAHPLLVAAMALAMVYPGYVYAMAIAGSVGLLHLVAERLGGAASALPVMVSRARSRNALPPLP
jgi:hypothetical protein